MLSATAIQIAAAALVCGLAVAVLLPAPAANEDGLLTVLLGAVCCATLGMGLLALTGALTATALLAAAGAAVMVPCAWLARAPEAPYEDDWEHEAEDDDGGGLSPSPRDPSPSPGPDHRRGAPAPAAVFSGATRTALSPPPSPAPALAAATRAASVPNPRFPHLAAPAWGGGPAVAPVVAPVTPPVVVAPAAPASVTEPEPVLLPSASRPARGDHPSVEHLSAPAPHPTRRRRPIARLRLLHGRRRRRRFGGAGRDRASR